MELREALTALGKEIGIAELAPDRWGICQIRFDGSIPVSVSGSDEEGTLALLATIGPMDDAGPEVLENLLAANYLGCGTGGAALSIDDAGLLVLERALPARELSHRAWLEAVTRFVNVAEFWLTRYDEGNLAFDAASAVAPAAPVHIIRV